MHALVYNANIRCGLGARHKWQMAQAHQQLQV